MTVSRCSFFFSKPQKTKGGQVWACGLGLDFWDEMVRLGLDFGNKRSGLGLVSLRNNGS
jgi:hypothetical protein